LRFGGCTDARSAARGALRALGSRLPVAPFGYAYAGAGLPLDSSVRLASEVQAEGQAFAARRELCANLASAEQAEAAAAQQLAVCQQNANIKVSEAQEQARRAAEAERIHAAAMEEFRMREAEAQRTAQMATEAKAIFDRAEAAFKQAEAARAQEVAAAEKTAEVARAAESQFVQSSNHEANTASTLARVQQTLSGTPVPRAPYY